MNAVAIYNVSDMMTMAGAIAKSGLFGMKSADQALALMLVAQAEGQHPATITQDYDIIQGKACRKTHSVMARFQQMGGKVEWHKLDEVIADATFSHPSGGSLRMTWTIDQAKKAGLVGKDNWKNYPRAMLRARVIAEGVRAVYPAAIGGMMVAEEAQDSPLIERDMGNAVVDDGITAEQAADIECLITETGADIAAFCKYMRVDSVSSIKQNDFNKAMTALEAKRRKSAEKPIKQPLSDVDDSFAQLPSESTGAQ